MTTPLSSPPPASAPWTGTGGGATRPQADGDRVGRAALEEYAALMASIAACSGRSDHEAEERLRNRAQVVLARLHCPGAPPPAVPAGNAEPA